MITTTAQVYEFVNQISRSSRECGYNDIATRLDDAMHRGSSGLEILGAIKNVLEEERVRLNDVVDEEDIKDVIGFVDRSFGRQ